MKRDGQIVGKPHFRQPLEHFQGIEQLTKCAQIVEAADDTVVDKLIALGVISILDLEDVGTEPLIKELNIDAAVAEELVAAAVKETKRLAAESKSQAESLLEQEQQAKAPDNEQMKLE